MNNDNNTLIMNTMSRLTPTIAKQNIFILSYKCFQQDYAYRNSISISMDTFWPEIEGASYSCGQRWNIDRSTGQDSRV